MVTPQEGPDHRAKSISTTDVNVLKVLVLELVVKAEKAEATELKVILVSSTLMSRPDLDLWTGGKSTG
ncbi:hypothetical protein BaRGS_00016035 [Batillaria attramentaria]|uniref:Uncharacterized protein n=1 Tax=Batillaria attramentaria TaxID=370345 RepID=A0ABD0L0T5_9CAEN